MFRRLLFAFAFAAALSARAQRPLEITSDGGSIIDLKSGETVFKDNVRMSDGNLLLVTDELRVSKDQTDITATGHVVFSLPPPPKLAQKVGPIRLLADKLVYHRINGTFNAEQVRLGAHPFYAEGESAAGTLTEITVNHTTFTYGEPGPWQPTWKADKVVASTLGQKISTENAQVGIGHVQPFPFPKFTQDIQHLPFTNVSLSGGYRRSLGAFADAGLRLPVAPTAQVGLDLGVYTNRGVLVGPAGGYDHAADGADLHGYFRSGFISDHGDRKTDVLGRPVPQNRGYFEWEHTQQLAENLSLTAQLNWWKDSEILRDFRPRSFFSVQEPDTFAEGVYAGKNYFVSLFARFHPNSFERVQERLPELRFDLLPLAVGAGFYERFRASVAVLRENPPTIGPGYVGYSLLGGPRLRSDRLDAYYAVSRPMAAGDYFNFTPVAGGRVTHYANISGTARTGNYTRTLGELGFDTALRSSATFDYKNALWKIDGLRHLLTPRLTYRYIPEADRGRGRIPTIDRQVFSTYLQPLGLGDTRNLDDLRATNTLRIGVDNTVQTRDATYGSRDLFTFNVASDFRFKRAPGERDLSEIHSELAFAPASWLQVDLYNRVSPRSLTLQEFNSGVTLRDGNAWSLRFSNNFLRRQIEDYVVDGRVRINENYEALTRLHYDARQRRFNEQAYGLVQNLGNAWRLSYIVSLYAGPRRESSFGFNVRVEAFGF